MIGTLLTKRKALIAIEKLNRGDLKGYLDGWADDGVFIYPGDIHVISGLHAGKEAVGKWFQHFFDQFPHRHFTVQHVAVTNLFDWVGNNVLAIHWEAEVTNRFGNPARGAGITLVTIRRGKTVRVEDYIFDTGDRFRAAWTATPAET